MLPLGRHLVPGRIKPDGRPDLALGPCVCRLCPASLGHCGLLPIRVLLNLEAFMCRITQHMVFCVWLLALSSMLLKSPPAYP